MPTPTFVPSDRHYPPFPKRQLLQGLALVSTIVVAPFLAWPPLARHLLAADYLPHLYCYLGKPGLVWMHVGADLVTGLAYISISATLVYLAYKGNREIPFHWMFLAFSLFIVVCGAAHFMDVLTIWIPVYVLSGVVKIVTALASVTTAVLLPTTIPAVLAVVRAARASERASEDKIEGLNKEMARQNAELVAANAELDSFCHSVSHDLRTPLRAIDGFTLALLEDCENRLEPQERVHLHQIRSSTKRMAQLIDDMLTLSHAVRREITLQHVDLSQLAREVAAQLQSSEPERHATFVIAPGLLAEADQNLLQIVLANILGNAWKFTSRSPHAHIEVGTCEQNSQHVYFVRDNGVGFEMEYQNKLFQPFQRLHDASDFPGNGVGLATVQRIVHRLGGRVWAEATVGQGATFYFSLPATGIEPKSPGGRDGNASRLHFVGGRQPWRRRLDPPGFEEARRQK